MKKPPPLQFIDFDRMAAKFDVPDPPVSLEDALIDACKRMKEPMPNPGPSTLFLPRDTPKWMIIEAVRNAGPHMHVLYHPDHEEIVREALEGMAKKEGA